MNLLKPHVNIVRVELISTARQMGLSFEEILVILNQNELLKFSDNFCLKTLCKWYHRSMEHIVQKRKESIAA